MEVGNSQFLRLQCVGEVGKDLGVKRSFSIDDQLLVGLSNGNILFMQRNEEKQFEIEETLEAHKEEINEVVMSYDKKLLITHSHDFTIKFWQLGEDNKYFLLQTIETPDNLVRRLLLSKESKYLIIDSQDNKIQIYEKQDDNTFELSQELSGHKDSIMSFILSEDETRIFSSVYEEIRIWEKQADGKFYGDSMSPRRYGSCICSCCNSR